MGRVLIGALFVSLAALPATAMTTEIDTDGDGLASYAELQVVYPELTEELFWNIDADGDGYVNDEEFLAAIGTQLLAEPRDTV